MNILDLSIKDIYTEVFSIRNEEDALILKIENRSTKCQIEGITEVHLQNYDLKNIILYIHISYLNLNTLKEKLSVSNILTTKQLLPLFSYEIHTKHFVLPAEYQEANEDPITKSIVLGINIREVIEKRNKIMTKINSNNKFDVMDV